MDIPSNGYNTLLVAGAWGPTMVAATQGSTRRFSPDLLAVVNDFAGRELVTVIIQIHDGPDKGTWIVKGYEVDAAGRGLLVCQLQSPQSA